MTNEHRQEIEHACTQLSMRFAKYADFRDYPALVALFVEDGVFERMGQRHVGSEAILALMATRPLDMKTRHICSNIVIDALGEDTATGVTYVQLYRHDGGGDNEVAPASAPRMVGDYHDSFVRTAHGWRFAERTFVLEFG